MFMNAALPALPDEKPPRPSEPISSAHPSAAKTRIPPPFIKSMCHRAENEQQEHGAIKSRVTLAQARCLHDVSADTAT